MFAMETQPSVIHLTTKQVSLPEEKWQMAYHA